MTNDQRREVYNRWRAACETTQKLKTDSQTAMAVGNQVFESHKDIDKEIAYSKADQAGWLLCDELDDEARPLEVEASALYKILDEHGFDLGDYQSCCAYGLSIKKPVTVVFMDGREVDGLIYPLVYDNPQEMLLVAEDGTEYFLDEGWEVYDVSFC